ncbi:hypothetical protein [Lysobacter silvisoli]|uniref:Uncharacterized protein n=1 Tax=Lysobacter silvisoli TaxID=2293254 RepID=A0A371JXC0_9GAMM|nr:hypothetical protein [Lysobacter silvisoli]RDZ26298.1 hypothetical protein DX914_18715 [Lysobacter silvisoli]
MNAATHPELADQVHQFARNWLGHDLSENERKQLAEFMSSLSATEAVLGGYTDQARKQAADVVAQGRQRVEEAMQSVLGATRAAAATEPNTATGAAAPAKPAAPAAAPATGSAPPPTPPAGLTREEQAILQMLQAARTLSDLRPSQLQSSREGETPAAQLAIVQIADRLANLVKSEVKACFDREYGPLARRIEEVLEASRASGSAPAAAHPPSHPDASS